MSDPSYFIWKNMMRRCYDPKDCRYHAYGARGIMVCERWHKHANFKADMGVRPDGLTLDRIDVNGNYEPSNCRWATLKEQGRNRRGNRFIEFGGLRLCQADWARKMGVSDGLVHGRLRRGWSIERTLTTPSGSRS